MAGWLCPECEARNTGAACRTCGAARPAPEPLASAPARAARCPADGLMVAFDGTCPSGLGYPATTACPFACPLCRQPLGWAGDCPSCHGIVRLGATWTFPGARYELEKGHWTLEDPALDRQSCSSEDNAAGMRALRKLAGRTRVVIEAGPTPASAAARTWAARSRG